MLIQHIGHAEFLIETESGVRIVTDPYDAGCGYPVRKLETDIVLVSHAHHDHNATENLNGFHTLIDHAGIYTPDSAIRVTAIPGYHDDEMGRKRGETLMFRVETEGLTVVHLGDLGCDLNEEQIRKLGRPDILMIPVGGFYTIDGHAAMKIARKLEAKTVLPMHYRTGYNADWPISGPEEFLQGYGKEEVRTDAEALRITSGDIECLPKVVLFRMG